MWTDVAGFWVNVAVAVGTLSAVGVSLYLAASARRREREAVTRSAASELLDALADAYQVLPMMPVSSVGVASSAGREQWAAAIGRVNRAFLTVVPLTTVEIQERWSDLKFLLFELSAAGVPRDGASARPGEWTSIKVARAQQDVEAYIAYVQDSVLAVMDGRKPPPTVERPDLRRDDNRVWLVAKP